MTIWVWARDEDTALEMAWQCQEYYSREEAVRKSPLNLIEEPMQALWRIEVIREANGSQHQPS
jgi:hypothetical protein